jgi:hypothetical protein
VFSRHVRKPFLCESLPTEVPGSRTRREKLSGARAVVRRAVLSGFGNIRAIAIPFPSGYSGNTVFIFNPFPVDIRTCHRIRPNRRTCARTCNVPDGLRAVDLHTQVFRWCSPKWSFNNTLRSFNSPCVLLQKYRFRLLVHTRAYTDVFYLHRRALLRSWYHFVYTAPTFPGPTNARTRYLFCFARENGDTAQCIIVTQQ